MHEKDAAFAIYRDRKAADEALVSLKNLGFKRSAIRVFQSTRIGSKDFSGVTHYQIENGAVIGAVVGAVFAATLVLFFAGDLTMTTLIFAAAGCVFGGLVGAAGGALVGLGTPEPTGKRYGQYLDSGGVLVSIHLENSDQGLPAQEVLAATGGQDIHLINELDTWESVNQNRIELVKSDISAC